MIIDRTNYELFFIDYFDGNLSDADIALLMDFLEKNSDLKLEFENFEEITISDNSAILFNSKNELKHIDKNSKYSDDLFDAFAVEFVENQLTKNQKNEFLNSISENQELQSELNFYKSTKLEIDNSIVFENKNSLKHKTVQVNFKPIQYAAAIAASVLLFYTLFQLNNNSSEKIISYVPREIKGFNIADNKVDEEIIFTKNVNQKHKTIHKNILAKSVSKPEIISQTVEPKIDYNVTKDNVAQTIEKEVIIENTISVIDPKIETKNIAKVETKTTNSKNTTLKDLAIGFIKTKILKVDKNKEENISLWTLADVGVNKLNKVSKRDIKLNKELSSKGKVKTFSLVAGNFSIEKK